MFLSDLLYEEGRSRSVSITAQQFKDMLPNIRLALKQTENGNKIFRGTRNKYQIIVSDPSKYERESANTTNQYNLLISHMLPSWQEWPKRSRSLICSEDPNTAEAYSMGNPFIVLPLGNPIIAVCPYEDFWNSFQIMANDFNELFLDFFKTVRYMLPDLNYPDDLSSVQGLASILKLYDQLAKANPPELEKIKKDFESVKWGIADRRKMSTMLLSGHSMSALDQFFDPTANNFKKARYSEWSSRKTAECWFSGPAVLVKTNYFNQLMN